MTRPTVAEVNLWAVRKNLAAVRSVAGPNVRVMAIVKADAYGHGALRVARVLEDAGVDCFGVVLAVEGLALRADGIERPILVLGTLFADDVEPAIEANLTPAVDDLDQIRGLAEAARRAGRTVNVHLKVDTGMNRLGVRAEEALEPARAIAEAPWLDFEGVFTHFACADCVGHPAMPGQLKRFSRTLADLRRERILPPVIHAANSSAAISLPPARFKMVRSGLALYGIAPDEAAARAVDLVPAMTLKSRVARVKRVPAGESVSYGHTWTAPRDSVVGVLPIGYGDGYPRALSNRAAVRVGGRLCPVVGVVCMDATMVDLTDVPDARPGMEAILIEPDASSPLSASALAALAGTIPYEIVTCIGKRVPRTYRE